MELFYEISSSSQLNGFKIGGLKDKLNMLITLAQGIQEIRDDHLKPTDQFIKTVCTCNQARQIVTGGNPAAVLLIPFESM